MLDSVTISIVTHNSKHIFHVLNQIKTELAASSVGVMVFDNASAPAYQNQLKAYQSDQIQITLASVNKGFGFGHNYNLARIKTTYFICCNPDILLKKADFTLMLHQLQARPEISMVTPKIVDPKGETQYLIRRRLDVFDYLLRFVPFGFVKRLFAKRLAHYECRDLSNQTQLIKYGSGAFMFLRAQAMREIGGFDERFFMYFEDNDLCDRLRQAGGKICYVPAARVVHYYARDSHKHFSVFIIFLKSMTKYFNKWGWQFF
ncbi:MULTISPECIES: glycosyltransferase [Loigolactobacillus]|uniref:Glycosyl transferase family 2 n=1 Tax=Loigolactobacillus backii TaxID=375175 RepID=A0A192H3S8_9LACO|nr:MULTISPECIES: glycosyltransferase [Loigolactobacillus]ANK63474.1 glycosyl transferase family 2 [Loigolactobacillus backii]ANK70903.1 glycosyl transferase family 2 [Loigolactobacillus backii]MDA5388146.1 glycosyltransferase [Loigolactobacillus backii]MDA5390636.1 glycosyltransferase [Loigolactobacillus backii]